MDYMRLRQVIDQQFGKPEWLLTNISWEGILLNGEKFEEYVIDDKDDTTWILKDGKEYRFHIENGIRIGDTEAYILKLLSEREVVNE